MELFRPSDVEQAHAEWKANCGPTAIAALLGKPLAEVRPAFPWFPARPWCSPTQLTEALASLNVPQVRWVTYGIARGSPHEQRSRMPRRGLAVVQVDGPWCDLADKRVAYRYTHTVAVSWPQYAVVIGEHRYESQPMVYDVNAGTDEEPGGWTHVAWWEKFIMDELFVKQTKRATGWFVRSKIDLAK